MNLLHMLLESGYIPVITPLALADTGEAVNVDGDRVAAHVAAALNAATLVILSNVPGLLADVQNVNSIIAHVAACDIPGYEQVSTGGMRRKLMGTREALHGGVQQVIIADARVTNPIRSALIEKGTVFA